jgi:predicted site-specific integrase-resolvase
VSPEDDEWVSLVDAAKMTGINPSTLERWMREGRIPSQRRPDGSPAIRLADVLGHYVGGAEGEEGSP